MQVMPRTAEYLGFKPNQMLTPEIAITAGCLYNRRLYKLWGRQKVEDPHREAFTFASYNAGRGTVLRVYDDDSLNTWQEVYPDLPKETQDYVHKIYLKYDFYSKHFIP